MSTETQIQQVKDYLLSLQDDICAQLAEEDGSKDFIIDAWEREGEEGAMGIGRRHRNRERRGQFFSCAW
jgi:coproporphyrinogen III oxidase